MNAVVRAIDLGFGNTKFVSSADGEHTEYSLMPSVAVLAPGEVGTSDLVGSRKTVCVPVGDVWYEVGYEIDGAIGAFKSRPAHDNYSGTAQYLALTAGALRYMGCKEIDLLVVGLPVSEFQARRKELEKLLTKEPIRISGTESVVVRKVQVVAQPHGALFDYVRQHGEDTKVSIARNLVVDVGFRTFDWLTTEGLKVYSAQSHSVPLGVSAVLKAIADKVALENKLATAPDVDAIDKALRTRKGFEVFDRQYTLKSFKGEINAIASQAVDEMLSRIGKIYDIKNIVLVGGGASLYQDAVARVFNRHKLLKVKDPVFANVRGFQYLGERQVRQASAAQRSSERLAEDGATTGAGA